MSNRRITTEIQSIIDDVVPSNLSAVGTVATDTLTVYSIESFAIDQVLIIGEVGNAGSEIIKTHASTAPTGNTVTLASNLVKTHAKDTPVYVVDFNQIEYSHADTETGTKSILATEDINPEIAENFYRDTANTAGYYFTRFKNDINTSYSAYSDAIPFTGLPDNTVGYAIDTAMNELNAKFTDKLTFELLLGFSKQMLRLVRGKLKSWNNYKEYDQNFGTLSMGVRRFALPAEVYDQNSNKSILSLRVGDEASLTPIDRDEYLYKTRDVVYTEVAIEGAVSATSLVLDDTSDLSDDGSIIVYVSGTAYTIEYTANTRSTNTLTIAADQIIVTLPVDSQVWQNIEEAEPKYFSVQDGYVYLWPMITSSFEGRNLTGDYLTDIETIDSQMDVITGVKYDMLIPYLKWKIRAVLENSGKEDPQDFSYGEFRELLNDAIKNEPLPEGTAFRPRGESINRGRQALNKR